MIIILMMIMMMMQNNNKIVDDFSNVFFPLKNTVIPTLLVSFIHIDLL